MRRGVLSASAPVLTRPTTGLLGDTVMDEEAAERPATSASPYTRSLPSIIPVRHRRDPQTADIDRSIALMTRPRLGELNVLITAEARRRALSERLERVHTFEREKLERRRAELIGLHQHEVKLQRLEQAIASLHAVNEEKIARVRERTCERERQAATRRESALDESASKAGAMYSANARGFDEYHMATPPDHGSGTPLSPSQISPRSRAELSDALVERIARNEAGRQSQAEEQAKILDERRRVREVKTGATKDRKAERAKRSFDHLDERARGVEARLRQKEQAHSAAVAAAREAEREHLQRVNGRHESLLESKLERTQRQAEERARRHEARLAELAERTRVRLEKAQAHKQERCQAQQQHLGHILAEEDEARRQQLRRQRQEEEREAERRKAKERKVAERRRATMDLSRRRAEAIQDQEHALTEWGPCGGEWKLSKLMADLAKLRTDATGSLRQSFGQRSFEELV